MDELKMGVFTKHFKEFGIGKLAETLKSLGVAGADLCVRPGYAVCPENVEKALPAAAKTFRDSGLDILLVTTPGTFVDPDDPETEKMFAACGESGVKLIKLGYWRMDGQDYWQRVEQLRVVVEKFMKLSEKYGPKPMIHNHCYSTMGLNSAAAMNLVKGFDPRYVGIFSDTGHLSLVGEPLPMAFSIVGKYLSAVAVKALVREPTTDGKERIWKVRTVPVRDGYICGETLVYLLMKMEFGGPVVMHSEYAGFDVDSVIDQTRMDIRYMRGVMSNVREMMTRGTDEDFTPDPMARLREKT